MKPHYFDQPLPDPDDFMLKMAIQQGYVPQTCLLGGMVVMDETNHGRDACAGCEGPRERCHGRRKRIERKGITEEDIWETRQNGAGLGD